MAVTSSGPNEACGVLTVARLSHSGRTTQPMRDLAQEHGKQDDDGARYQAIAALTAAIKREKRYLRDDECRRIIASAWGSRMKAKAAELRKRQY